jgi:hypothetical protein
MSKEKYISDEESKAEYADEIAKTYGFGKYKKSPDMELAKFLCSLPEKDKFADIENMQRNLTRALSTATKDGIVVLYAAEIKCWLEGITQFLESSKSKDEKS